MRIRDLRVGFSEDVHRFKIGRKLYLGGIYIPKEDGLDGHSDADVVIHALAESILGALALGDLGTFFPEGEARYAGISSVLLLKQVLMKMDELKYRVHNVDIQIAAKHPFLRDYIPLMRSKLAPILKIDVKDISIKAMTYNGVDEIGEGKAIKASSVVLLIK